MPSIRTVLALLPIAVLAALAGCASAPASGSCEMANVPPGAVFNVRQGADIATYPATMANGGSACQRVWYGDRARPADMKILATYYFEGGRVQRLVGRVPGGAEYECHYRDGELDSARSRNVGQCPKASEAKPGS